MYGSSRTGRTTPLPTGAAHSPQRPTPAAPTLGRPAAASTTMPAPKPGKPSAQQVQQMHRHQMQVCSVVIPAAPAWRALAASASGWTPRCHTWVSPLECHLQGSTLTASDACMRACAREKNEKLILDACSHEHLPSILARRCRGTSS